MKFNFICSMARKFHRSPCRRFANAIFIALFALFVVSVSAQESYFVTYSHQLEEPGNLEIGFKSIAGSPGGAARFVGNALEFEYGVKAWWTSELYLDGQSTSGQSTLFTGFRWENRVRPRLAEHWINPVLYFEFENINSADKSLLEVVGHDSRDDFLDRNDRHEKKREAELKLILSSNLKGWNISENIIAEKNLAGEPWEFGYATGVSRPFSLIAGAKACVLCRENLSAGAEMYGGLGERHSFGLRDTSHYFAPVIEWRVPGGTSLKLSPGFGLNDNSLGFVFRFGVSYEIDQIASRTRRR
jgi:hypothetical protein